MILNRTNCKTLEKLFGSAYIEDWPGKKIQIYSAKVKAFGDVTEALRIRDFRPNETVDNSKALDVIKSCETLKQLQITYSSLSKIMQADKEVIALKNELKGKLK